MPLPFRLRLRTADEPSPERHVILLQQAPNLSQGTQIALAFAKPKKSLKPVNDLDAIPKPTLIRRVTSKLNISIPLKSGPDASRSRPSTRDPRLPTPAQHTPTLPNSFVSKHHREAALRERGLLPPRKDLSEQERERDARIGSCPSPASLTFDGSSEAERLKASWLAVNRDSESSESDHLHASPYLQPTRAGPKSMPTLPTSEADNRRSSEGVSAAGRPSLCSSLPPLSISSYLEVLHEEPSDQGPITPPPPMSFLPIIVSSPLEEPSSPVLAESPVSCTFSSQCPGSTLESSQSDHAPPVPEKDHVRPSASHRRTSDSSHRPRKIVRSSFSRLGTHSLTSLRHSMTEGFGRTSTSTLSSADHASISHAPRTAIRPTIHSIGSIIKETGGIEDAESRRLSELAFLD